MKRKKQLFEGAVHGIFLLLGLITVGCVLLITVYLVISGIPAIRKIGLVPFLFGKTWKSTGADPSYGILPFILTSGYGTAGAIVLGVPVGFLTAVYLAKAAPPRIKAVLSAAVVQRNHLARLSPALRYVMPRVIRWPESAVNRGADFLHEYDYGYSGLPVRRVADLMRLSRMACGALSSVHCPLLVVQSWRDETVNPVSAEIIMRGAASERKRLVRLERSGHMITLGPEREQVWREVGEWLDAAQA